MEYLPYPVIAMPGAVSRFFGRIAWYVPVADIVIALVEVLQDMHKERVWKNRSYLQGTNFFRLGLAQQARILLLII